MNVGDTVWLKSGGPAMTIYQITMGEAHCAWHGGRQTFPLHSLTKEQPGPAGRAPVTERDYGDWPPKTTEKLPDDERLE